jgi:hypothetical protein
VTWRNGLLRLWLIGTAAWLMGWAFFIHLTCHSLPNGTLMCSARPDGWFAHLGAFAAWTYFELFVLGISVPVGILILGLTTVWLRRAFKSHRLN